MCPAILLALSAVLGADNGTPRYCDGRPAAKLRLDAVDHGVVLRHGDGPGQCDILGARDVWVFEAAGTYYMHYDAAGPKGWLAALAISKDLIHWQKKGPVLELGKTGENDSASASYGTTFYDGRTWHMFYLGTPHTSPAPDLVPAFPYLTMKARSTSPAGPWAKQEEIVPFQPKPDTYYSATASPGQVVKHGDDFRHVLQRLGGRSNPSNPGHRPHEKPGRPLDAQF